MRISAIVWAALILGLLVSTCWAQTHPSTSPEARIVRLTLFGDSMMAYDPPERPQQGWGTYLSGYLVNVDVTNLASSGRSTKSFIQGDMQPDGTIKPPLKWPKVLTTPADYWLISFGGNELKPDFRRTDPLGSYTANLSLFIDEARKRGITPVLITPTHPVPPKDGSPEPLKPYADAVKLLAKKQGVPMMDLYDFTTSWQAKEAADIVKFQPPELGGHFNRAGAEIFAAEMARQFSKIEPKVSKSSATTQQETIAITR